MPSEQQQTMQFQAEVTRLLDIVANSLYSNREVFLRELISNASDACDRLRYLALLNEGLLESERDLEITIIPDSAAGTLTVHDNGVGMNRDELIENLGTIAHSGSSAFLAGLEEKEGGGKVDLIGQFGVGFYSAFMVADQVVVESRRAGESEGWRWESDGKGGFTVDATAPEIIGRGTSVILHLKPEAKSFLQEAELERIVRTYSDHIAVPIKLGRDGEARPLNQASALWTRPKNEITEEQYREFYHHVSHALDAPWDRLHFKAEGVMEYAGLLYIPGARPLDLFEPERRHSVKLYVRRVFITDDCDGLIAPYLRFLRGVIDSEDLPLNVSREMLQHNPLLTKIRKAVTKRVLGELESKAEKEPEAYQAFWESFGAVLKEGIYEDTEQRETLMKLARFRSTAVEGWTGLADYKARMKPGQQAIYFITGDDLEMLKRSPQLEGFAAKGVEVLLLTDPVDDFWIPAVGGFEGMAFQSATRAGADLAGIEGEAEEAEATLAENAGELIAYLKSELGGSVKDVRASSRLTSSPVCLVSEEGDIDLHLSRMLRAHQQLDEEDARVLEVNLNHPLVEGLASRLKDAGTACPRLRDRAWLLYDQARILQGEGPSDAAEFCARMTRALSEEAESGGSSQAEAAQ